jgi:hypothetical protein
MSDHITEQRRLSALWLNMIGATIVSAGACGFLAAIIVQPDGTNAARAALLAAGSVLLGGVLHCAARAVLRMSP